MSDAIVVPMFAASEENGARDQDLNDVEVGCTCNVHPTEPRRAENRDECRDSPCELRRDEIIDDCRDDRADIRIQRKRTAL